MAIHGLPRATIDIDLLVLSENLADVWKIAETLGYDVEGLPLHFHDGQIEIVRQIVGARTDFDGSDI